MPRTEKVDDFYYRRSLMPSYVPPGAVTQQTDAWQSMRELLNLSGLQPQVGDWVFLPCQFFFPETSYTPNVPPPLVVSQFERWGIGPSHAWGFYEALKDSDMSLEISIP